MSYFTERLADPKDEIGIDFTLKSRRQELANLAEAVLTSAAEAAEAADAAEAEMAEEVDKESRSFDLPSRCVGTQHLHSTLLACGCDVICMPRESWENKMRHPCLS